MKPTESADVHADRHVSAVHVEHHDRIGPTWPTDLSPLFAAAPANLGVEHDPRWMAALQQALGHEPHVLIARDDAGNMTGYLPMALVSSRWFGRMLVSLPYVNRAGVVASDAAVAHGLIEHATALAGRLGVDYLELRHSIPVDHQAFNASRQDKVLMTMPLPADEQALWDQLRSKVRSHIRGGRRHDLRIQFGGRELLDDFYRVFAVNMRDLGTPVYGRELFVSLLEHFPEQAELVIVHYRHRAVAGALLMHHAAVGSQPACTQVPSASSLRRFNSTNANMWMYHRLLLRAIERGSKLFDFGRSTVDSGTYQFKKQWGAVAHPLHWQQVLLRSDRPSPRPDDVRFRRRVAVWKRLPVWLTRWVGPSIVRGVP